MEQHTLNNRILEKITQLGEAKRELSRAVQRLTEENASLHRINKELQNQVDELMVKNNELKNTRSQNTASNEAFKGATRQRITELVKEVEECITLLNK